MDTLEVLHLQHLDEPLHEEDTAECLTWDRLLYFDAVIDYTAPTRLINFRIYASSGNPVIYNNNVPVLRGRNNFCASIAYLIFL